MSTAVVPSVCRIVTWHVSEASSLNIKTPLTFLLVDEPGLATIVVVVALEIAVFVRPGVTVVPFNSMNEAWTLIAAALDVTTRRRSEVDVRSNIRVGKSLKRSK